MYSRQYNGQSVKFVIPEELAAQWELQETGLGRMGTGLPVRVFATEAELPKRQAIELTAYTWHTYRGEYTLDHVFGHDVPEAIAALEAKLKLKIPADLQMELASGKTVAKSPWENSLGMRDTTYPKFELRIYPLYGDSYEDAIKKPGGEEPDGEYS
jgi:hypothetical protein